MTVENVKQAFTRVMNSLVLDGLDLMDDDIRLFAVNKSRKSGHTTLQRILAVEIVDRRNTGRRTKSVMKTIVIVAEGPRDFELIAAVIDTITNEENSYQMIQD